MPQVSKVSRPKTYVHRRMFVAAACQSGWQDNNPPTKAHLLTWPRTISDLWSSEIYFLPSFLLFPWIESPYELSECSLIRHSVKFTNLRMQLRPPFLSSFLLPIPPLPLTPCSPAASIFLPLPSSLHPRSNECYVSQSRPLALAAVNVAGFKSTKNRIASSAIFAIHVECDSP